MRAEFTTFYESEAPYLVRSVALAIGEPVAKGNLAEEAVAEAFARAWSRWPELRTHERPAAWVMRVALNLTRSRFRRRKVERDKAPIVARPEAMHDPQPHTAAHVWDAVRDLPEQERTLIALRYVADLRQNEIASLLGVPAGTVASGLHRARRKLGVALGPVREEELT